MVSFLILASVSLAGWQETNHSSAETLDEFRRIVELHNSRDYKSIPHEWYNFIKVHSDSPLAIRAEVYAESFNWSKQRPFTKSLSTDRAARRFRKIDLELDSKAIQESIKELESEIKYYRVDKSITPINYLNVLVELTWCHELIGHKREAKAMFERIRKEYPHIAEWIRRTKIVKVLSPSSTTVADSGSAVPKRTEREKEEFEESREWYLKCRPYNWSSPFTLVDFREVKSDGLRHLKYLKLVYRVGLNDTQTIDNHLMKLEKLTKVQDLQLARTAVTSDGLPFIKDLVNLTTLNLEATNVDNRGLRQIQEMKKLEMLALSHTKVTNEGLSLLSNFPKLDRLYLAGTSVSDDGIADLLKIKSLRFLDVSETQITERGVEQLRAALPNCEVFR